MKSVLVIDDEESVRKLLTITLSSNDFSVSTAETGQAGIQAISHRPPDLVMLDLGLPDIHGYDVLQHLREWYSNPIIIISALNDEEVIVKALDAGANDYCIKPFRASELMARVRTALRHAGVTPTVTHVQYDNLVVDFVNRQVVLDHTPVRLTTIEYALLSLLVRNPGRVLTHQYILRHVWGQAYQQESQYLRVYVAQLRRKIEADPNRPQRIITESGIGYRFVISSDN